MPADRQAQVRAALQAAAALSDLAGSPNVRLMSGDWAGCHRLRVGSYRAILRIVLPEPPEAPEGTLEVLLIGPRGDIYK
jgi:mRNA-degrading endonuclease RelE of RelBE toxin-antitoxin system